MNIRNVAVIGAGPMGLKLAEFFAGAGFETVLEDVLPSNLRKAAEQLMAPARSNLRFASSVEDAVRTADLIVDCVPDELDSKLEIFSLLDRMAPPHAVFVTPTRSLSIADLASCTYRADRCIAVEIDSAELREGGALILVATSRTSAEVLDAVVGFWTSAGFVVESRADPAEASVASGTLF
jgi:3-hydroxybutyryl-CoA dehydrogenase